MFAKLILGSAVAATLALAGAANAVVVVSNDFELENGGASFINYTGFSNLFVTAGSVDLVATGDFGIVCAGGSGTCVDMDGSTFASGRLDTGSYAFNAGDTVTFTWDLSGNQRSSAQDDFSGGFVFGDLTLVSSYSILGAWGNVLISSNVMSYGIGTGTGILGDTPFQSYGIQFVAGQAGTVSTYLETVGNDNFGPIADNLVLDITPGTVPEPASWALMIGGFGLVGAALRRHRAAFA